MDNWGIIKKFASWIGVVFVVFAVLAALLNYELNGVMYSSAAPLALFVYNLVITMLPFLAASVVSFKIAALSSQQEKAAAEPETQQESTKTSGTQRELDDFPEKPT